MAYEKQDFQPGQVLSADNMNHLEAGFAPIETDVAQIKNMQIEDIVDELGNSIITRSPADNNTVILHVTGGGGDTTVDAGIVTVGFQVSDDGLSTRTYNSTKHVDIGRLSREMQLIEASIPAEAQGSTWNITAVNEGIKLDGTINGTHTIVLTFGYNGAIRKAQVLRFTVSLAAQAFSDTVIYTNDAVTETMCVTNSVLSNPSAQSNDWTVTTTNGSVRLTGTASAATNLTLCLQETRA